MPLPVADVERNVINEITHGLTLRFIDYTAGDIFITRIAHLFYGIPVYIVVVDITGGGCIVNAVNSSINTQRYLSIVNQ